MPKPREKRWLPDGLISTEVTLDGADASTPSYLLWKPVQRSQADYEAMTRRNDETGITYCQPASAENPIGERPDETLGILALQALAGHAPRHDDVRQHENDCYRWRTPRPLDQAEFRYVWRILKRNLRAMDYSRRYIRAKHADLSRRYAEPHLWVHCPGDPQE